MMKNNNITINGRSIGADYKPYIIAEMSANHNGDLSAAFSIIDAAKVAGADAVKIQTYTPDTITLDAQTDDFLIKGGLWDGRTLYDLYQEAHTPDGTNLCLIMLKKLGLQSSVLRSIKQR